MKGKVQWILVALVVVGLAVVGVVFGLNLIPSRATAAQRGTIAPWLIAWGMIAITVVSAVFLAGFLLATGRKTVK